MGIEKDITLPNPTYYSEAFINAVHANKAVILKSSGTTTQAVDIHDAGKYHGDLYGYLRARNVEIHLYPAILVINNLNSQQEFSEHVKVLSIPDSNTLYAIAEQINLSA
jgi:hypothetical protein